MDLEDFERVHCFNWWASHESRGTKVYARRRKLKSDDQSKWTGHKIRLHHFVLNIAPSELPLGHVVDHLNHDGLDCRKSNLEIITQTLNMQRSQGWKKKRLTVHDLFL